MLKHSLVVGFCLIALSLRALGVAEKEAKDPGPSTEAALAIHSAIFDFRSADAAVRAEAVRLLAAYPFSEVKRNIEVLLKSETDPAVIAAGRESIAALDAEGKLPSSELLQLPEMFLDKALASKSFALLKPIVSRPGWTEAVVLSETSESFLKNVLGDPESAKEAAFPVWVDAILAAKAPGAAAVRVSLVKHVLSKSPFCDLERWEAWMEQALHSEGEVSAAVVESVLAPPGTHAHPRWISLSGRAIEYIDALPKGEGTPSRETLMRLFIEKVLAGEKAAAHPDWQSLVDKVLATQTLKDEPTIGNTLKRGVTEALLPEGKCADDLKKLADVGTP